MKAAVIQTISSPPRWDEFDEPDQRDGEELVQVGAAALTNFARFSAARTQRSEAGLPFVAGADGVGRLADGRRVYFLGSRAPFGSMAERTVIPAGQAFPVPDSIDDVTAAALMNPGISAWTSLADRAQLQPGQRVLVLGATGVTGRIAVQVARLLGAGSIVAVGRSPEGLARAAQLGADQTIRLDGDLGELLATAVGPDGVDAVIDYLWGPPVEALLTALTNRRGASGARPLRLVQVGDMAGGAITIPSAILRLNNLVILGNGVGTMTKEALSQAVSKVFEAAAAGKLVVEAETIPMRDVDGAWRRPSGGTRLVLVPL
jgi:NADPH2:quinone reductase